LPFVSLSQGNVKIKNKYLGKYSGVISAYQVKSDKGLLNVEETGIELVLNKDADIELTIGGKKNKATYNVLEKVKKRYIIEARTEGEVYVENLILNGKKKTITREGLFPQPNTELKKN